MLNSVLVVLSVILLILCLSLVVVRISDLCFARKVKAEVRELFSNNLQTGQETVCKAELDRLPKAVQKWLTYAQVIGKQKISTAHLKQEGSMRMKPEQPWMAEGADQYVTVGQPGFIWHAKIKAAPLLFIKGRDRYFAGKGNMLIKILALYTVVNGRGPEIDQGTLVRYLAEIIWYPTAALCDYITWEEVGPLAARATLNYGGVSASGEYTFNELGEVIHFTAKRYMESNGKYSLETWSAPMGDYREFHGFKIPTRGEITWKLAAGDFTWFKWKLTDIEYNVNQLI